MTISFIGAGTFGEHNNFDGAPVLHASTAQNDLLIAVGFLRGLNADANAMVLNSVGSGYTPIANFTHSTGSPMPRLFAYWKIAGAGEGAPAIDITPMATGASCLYQVATFRGTHLTSPIGVVGSNSENASAANIGPITGIAAAAVDGAVVVLGGRCDDWTSVADLSGDSLTWVEIADVFTTLGQDAGMVWNCAIWSGAAPTVTDKTFAVTGGSNNKGLGVMFEIKPPAAAPSLIFNAPARNNQHLLVR